MVVSPMGFVVCMAVLLLGYSMGGPVTIGLIASMAFGSTALVTLTSLGGSSPLIYTFFVGLLLLSICCRRRFFSDLGVVFGSMRPIWVLCAIMLSTAVGAWLFPRIFAGQTTVFVQSKGRIGIIEDALAPVSGNITQTGYFILGGLTAIAFSALILNGNKLDLVRRGFFTYCTLVAALGLIDFIGKTAGAGDVLAPIRTASYAMLTQAVQAGFARISGAYSEASAFGSSALACVALTYIYWRHTGSSYARNLCGLLLILLVLSTSSTAYVGLAVVSAAIGASMVFSSLRGRMETADVLIMIAIAAGLLLFLSISLYNEKAFDSIYDLIDAAIFNKSTSVSGQERSYWNVRSIGAFLDTSGLGVGLGSSSASSWPVAVLSQLGVLGSVLMVMLVFTVARGLGGYKAYADPITVAMVSAVRAGSLSGLVASSLISGTADPGMFFFISFAVINATRARVRLSVLEAKAKDRESRKPVPEPPLGRPGALALA